MDNKEQALCTSVRIQPASSEHPSGYQFGISGDQIVINDISLGGRSSYSVSLPIPVSSSNDTVFQTLLLPRVTKLFEGYNSFLVVFGAPKTGKAHTFYGTGTGVDKKGIIEYTCDAIFDEIRRNSSDEFFVTVSVFQLLQRTLTDLLNPGPRDTLVIEDHRICGAYLQGLAELEIKSSEEAMVYIQQARGVQDLLSRRSTTLGAPHVFIDIRVESHMASSSIIKQGLLRVALLAGTSGVSMQVNEGLKGLNTCLGLLNANEPVVNVPFRETPLTRLLQPGLGGNALCTFLGLVSSERHVLKDTVRTLQLLTKASAISNRAKVNFNTVQSTIARLRNEIAAARSELNLSRAGTALHDIDAHGLGAMKQLMKELDYVKTRSWEARRKLSKALEAERLENLRARGLMRALTLHSSASDALLGADQKEAQTSVALRDKLAMLVDNFARAQEELEDHTAQLQRHWESQRRAGGEPSVKDDKSNALERAVTTLRQQVARAQNELVLFQTAYKKHVGAVLAAEAEQRNENMLSASADADFSKLLDTFLDIKREMRADPALQAELARISKEAAAAEKLASKRYEGLSGPAVEQLKKQSLETVQRLFASREQCATMQWERNRLRAYYLETVFRHRVQMERFQDHLFFVFKSYRSHFEEVKGASEERYRELVGSAVRDSLRLSEDNAQLRTRLEALQNRQRTLPLPATGPLAAVVSSLPVSGSELTLTSSATSELLSSSGVTDVPAKFSEAGPQLVPEKRTERVAPANEDDSKLSVSTLSEEEKAARKAAKKARLAAEAAAKNAPPS